jgi:cytochrome c-type biogenesis protein CcsB
MGDKIFFTFAIALALVSAITLLLSLLSERRGRLLSAAGRAMLLLSSLAGCAMLALRWFETGQPPMISTFEVLVFFAAAIGLVDLTLDFFYRARILAFPAAVLALSVYMGASLCDKAVTPAVPALQNNFWLTIHVSICFAGYAAFAVAYVSSVLYLISRGGFSKAGSIYVIALTISLPATALGIVPAFKGNFETLAAKIAAFLSDGPTALAVKPVFYAVLIIGGVFILAAVIFIIFDFFEQRLKISEKLRSYDGFPLVSYKAVLAGFVLLGLGIISGSVWAEIAWGSYWSWDPKEVWALAAWLVYMLYLHLRRAGAWNETRLSWLIVVGFAAVMFTFFGTNYLLAGLHSYM